LFKEQYSTMSVQCHLLNQEYQALPSFKFLIVI
jgi:hypothetical protein